MSPPGRPKGEFSSAQHEGSPVTTQPAADPTLWRDARLATLQPGSPWGWIDDGALLVQGGQIAWVGALADLPAGLFARLGKSLIVQLAAIKETEWKSRDETLISFGPGLAPLTIGRPAALRLQDLLAGDGPGPTEGS